MPEHGSERFSIRRLDRIGAMLGLLLAFVLFPLRFFASQIYIVTLPIILIVACILYLLAVDREVAEGLPTFSRRTSRLLPGAVFLTTALLAVVAFGTGTRTPYFHVLAVLTAIAVLFQVFFTPESELAPGLILTEVLLLGIVVRFSGLSTTPGYIGIDIWTHMRFVEEILAQGSLSAIDGRKYYAAPLFHLIVAMASQLFNSSVRTALIMTAGLFTLVPIVIVYSISRLMLVERWALAAAALYAVGDHFLRWGLHIIPTNMGLVFFCAFLLFFGRVVHTKHRLRDYALLVGFSVAIVLTHQISTFIMLVVLFAGMLARALIQLDLFFARPASLNRILANPEPPRQGALFLFNLGLITFTWSLTPHRGDTFLETIFAFFVDTVTEEAGLLNLAPESSAAGIAADQAPQHIVQLVNVIDNAGFLLLLLLGIIGCLYALHGNRATHLTLTLVVSIVGMLVFVLGLPMFGIRNFVPGRWFAFLYIPLIIMGLVGIRHVSRRLPGIAVGMGLIVLLAALPGMMMIASPAVADDPVFDRVQERQGYSESELAGAAAVDRYIHDDEVTVFTDHPYQTMVERSGAHQTEPATVPVDGTVEHDVLMHRNQAEIGGVYFRDSNEVGYRRSLDRSAFCGASRSMVYDNGDARLCMT